MEWVSSFNLIFLYLKDTIYFLLKSDLKIKKKCWTELSFVHYFYDYIPVSRNGKTAYFIRFVGRLGIGNVLVALSAMSA